MGKTGLLVMLIVAQVARVTAQEPLTDAIKKDTLKPYQKYPKLPAFNIMEMDSSTIFNTYNIPSGKTTAIMFFDPGCKHCQHTMEKLEAGMDSIKDVQFYLVTLDHSMQNIRKFYEDYHLGDYKNFQVVGRDYEFFYISYYGIHSFPDIAVYDKQKKLLGFKEGTFTATEIYRMVHGDQ